MNFKWVICKTCIVLTYMQPASEKNLSMSSEVFNSWLCIFLKLKNVNLVSKIFLDPI